MQTIEQINCNNNNLIIKMVKKTPDNLCIPGDGNCLLHAASLGMWGFHDRSQEFLIIISILCRSIKLEITHAHMQYTTSKTWLLTLWKALWWFLTFSGQIHLTVLLYPLELGYWPWWNSLLVPDLKRTSPSTSATISTWARLLTLRKALY